MTDAIRTKIESEVDETRWPPLALHAKRDALFFVDRTLGLADVAYAIATNRAHVVAVWTEAKLLRRPTPEERAELDERGEAARLRFVIVQPFVLAQRLESEN